MNDDLGQDLQWAENYLNGCMDKAGESKSDWDRLLNQGNIYAAVCSLMGLLIVFSLYGQEASGYAFVFAVFDLLILWHRRNVIKDAAYWNRKWQESIDWAISYRDMIKKQMRGF